MIHTDEILKLTGESFDEGANAAMETLINALEQLHDKFPELSFAEVIAAIKTMKSESNITK